MGLLSSGDSSSGNRTFEPICTDGKRLVWVNSQAFDKVNEEDIDRIVG